MAPTPPAPPPARGVRVGIVGAGLAGAACARALADAGCAVEVFDKSRGLGGRMATRRAAWAREGGSPQAASFDHGVPWWTAQSPEFNAFLAGAQASGLVRRWAPRIVPAQGAPLSPGPEGWVAVPDMPAVCRTLLGGIEVHAGRAVTALSFQEGRWQLHSEGEPLAEGLDAVVLAIPPVQAAVLWEPHLPQWAREPQDHPMSPCWTLMALTDEPELGDAARHLPWDEMWPADPPLARVIRQDAKPGRPRVPGVAQWVLHAQAGWSHAHLEAAPQEVLPVLQRALEHALGTGLKWHHAVVHRWRYAQRLPQALGTQPALAADRTMCAWDPLCGLGACGEHLAAGGVEAAWASGRTLARVMLQSP